MFLGTNVVKWHVHAHADMFAVRTTSVKWERVLLLESARSKPVSARSKPVSMRPLFLTIMWPMDRDSVPMGPAIGESGSSSSLSLCDDWPLPCESVLLGK